MCLPLFLGACGPLIESWINTTYPPADLGAYTPGAKEVAGLPTGREMALHRELLVIDLHADPLLWGRDLVAPAAFAHVDLPRLVAGHVGIQVFAVPTQTPLPTKPAAPGRAGCADGDAINTAAWLHLARLRAPMTWVDNRARALDQAARFRDAVARSQDGGRGDGRFWQILTAGDLAGVLAARRDAGPADAEGRLLAGRPVVGALLALEGAHWIGETASVGDGLEELHRAGFRMVAPTHRFSNRLGTASEDCAVVDGTDGRGLSEDGRAFLGRAEEMGFVIDLAHLSDQGMWDALDELQAPPVISHTGLRGFCPDAPSCIGVDCDRDLKCSEARNLPDDLLVAVAQESGIVGIGLWPEAVGWGLDGIAHAFLHAYRALEGKVPDPADHLAFGTDYDGAVTVPFDVADMAAMTALLCRLPGRSARSGAAEKRLLTPLQVWKIAGGNACKVFAQRLPGGSAALAERICRPPAEADLRAC